MYAETQITFTRNRFSSLLMRKNNIQKNQFVKAVIHKIQVKFREKYANHFPKCNMKKIYKNEKKHKAKLISRLRNSQGPFSDATILNICEINEWVTKGHKYAFKN